MFVDEFHCKVQEKTTIIKVPTVLRGTRSHVYRNKLIICLFFLWAVSDDARAFRAAIIRVLDRSGRWAFEWRYHDGPGERVEFDETAVLVNLGRDANLITILGQPFEQLLSDAIRNAGLLIIVECSHDYFVVV